MATYNMIKILGLASLYDDFVEEYTGWRTFFTLPKESHKAMKHRNWNHFVKLHQLLQDNDIDAFTYLKAQFETIASWKKNSYPYPFQLATNNAMLRYSNYVDGEKSVKEDTGGDDKVVRKIIDNFLDDHTSWTREEVRKHLEEVGAI